MRPAITEQGGEVSRRFGIAGNVDNLRLYTKTFDLFGNGSRFGTRTIGQDRHRVRFH
jgi:hypothetical protein